MAAGGGPGLARLHLLFPHDPMFLAMLETEADRQKFTRLYEAMEKKIYAVTLRILGSPEQADTVDSRIRRCFAISRLLSSSTSFSSSTRR